MIPPPNTFNEYICLIVGDGNEDFYGKRKRSTSIYRSINRRTTTKINNYIIMRKIGKYEFKDEATADSKIKGLGVATMMKVTNTLLTDTLL